MEKGMEEIIGKGFTYGLQEEIMDSHLENGKIIRWLYQKPEVEMETHCCGPDTPTDFQQMQEEIGAMEKFEESLYVKIAKREQGVKAWRRVTLQIALIKVFEVENYDE
jgi:hypothetical protein